MKAEKAKEISLNVIKEINDKKERERNILIEHILEDKIPSFANKGKLSCTFNVDLNTFNQNDKDIIINALIKEGYVVSVLSGTNEYDYWTIKVSWE